MNLWNLDPQLGISDLDQTTVVNYLSLKTMGDQWCTTCPTNQGDQCCTACPTNQGDQWYPACPINKGDLCLQHRTRKHSSRMCTARLSTVGGGFPDRSPFLTETPSPLNQKCHFQPEFHNRKLQRPPFNGIPCQGQHPLLWMAALAPPPPPLVNKMTDRRKNITLPQTSFARGNKHARLSWSVDCPIH